MESDGIEGSQLELTCTVEAELGVRLVMDWVTPNDNIAKKEERTTIIPPSNVDEVDNHPELFKAVGKLFVNNLDKTKDTGYYQCLVKDKTDADNGHIQKEQKFHLLVKAKPLKLDQERTLILLKPETVQRKIVWKIIERFEDTGLKLVALKFIWATKEMAKEYYGPLENRTQYDKMIQYITSGPIVPMVWEGKSAIKKTLKLIGEGEPMLSLPGTIRSDFGADAMHNIIHGSLSNETANREISIWFNQNEIISWTSAHEQWTQF